MTLAAVRVARRQLLPGYLFDLHLDSEVGGSILLRNVGGLLLDYRIRDVTAKKTVFFLVTAVRTSHTIYKKFGNDQTKNYLSTVTTFRDLVPENLMLDTHTYM